MEKYDELLKYSDPKRVKRLTKKFLGDDVKLYVSTRKDKKYMVKDPDGKMIHFGSFNPPMEDFSKHLDLDRQRNFRNRNKKWADADKWSPAWLSYYLLWG